MSAPLAHPKTPSASLTRPTPPASPTSSSTSSPTPPPSPASPSVSPPGVGLNAYFTYTVVGFHGSKGIEYETALAAVFIEGILFILLSMTGIRQWLAWLILQSIMVASGAGIGLYLCVIGMQRSAGIGLVGGDDDATLVTLQGCILDAAGNCEPGSHMRSPTT